MSISEVIQAFLLAVVFAVSGVVLPDETAASSAGSLGPGTTITW